MPQTPPAETDLERATKEIYKQNFELSIRNKTLSVLRAIYAITMTSLKTQEVGQRIVDTIVKELGFSEALINIIDVKSDALQPLAITQSPQVVGALQLIGKSLADLAVPLSSHNNILVTCVEHRTMQMTTNMLDLLTPHADQATSDKIAKLTNVQSIIVYPLLINMQIFGTLALGIPKNISDLSRAEKETIEELINLVGIALDRAKLHEDLEHANEQLKLLDKLKDEFVSIASHELRTPMTSIKSYTWMVLNGKVGAIEPKVKEYLDKVYQSTERLLRLINEMLDISRIESGRVQLKSESINIADLAHVVQDEFQVRTAEQNLTLNIDVQGEIPAVMADREKLHQVLENLVGNSYKFTPAGGQVTIRIRLVEGNLEVAVIDTGQGISPEDKDKLFTKFSVSGNSLVTMTGGGSGLGLYITKQYVEMHGGKISLESEVGKGTTVAFFLPISKTSP